MIPRNEVDASTSFEELWSQAETVSPASDRRSPDTGEDAGVRTPSFLLSLSVVASVLLSVVPFTRVLHLGPWLWGTILVVTALVAAGYVLRLKRIGWYLAPFIQMLLSVFILAALFFSESAFLGFIPSPRIFDALPLMASSVRHEILTGYAPIEVSPALALFIVAAAAVLTVFADHTTTSARLPLLSAALLAVVALIPAFAIPTDLDMLGVFCAILILLIQLRAGSWDRGGRRSRPGGFMVTSFVTVAAVLITSVVTPMLPLAGTARTSFGTGVSVRPSLDLGQDLREQSTREVLRVASDGVAPYTRIATLSSFTGAEWLPDSDATSRISPSEKLAEPRPPAENIEVRDVRSHIEVTNLTSSWLPLPYRASTVEGLTGNWWFAPWNGTASSTDSSADNESYVITSRLALPSREQARAASATDSLDGAVRRVPEEIPAEVPELARSLTMNATNDYDRLIALQTWFRTEFSYSLDAPITGNYDGSSASAISGFLEKKAGYCVHFASTFAVMARTMDMPSRVVVGFLPGTETNARWDGMRVHSVAAKQLHAWPEVYFEGIGWIPFEPTVGLGRETALAPENVEDEESEPTGEPSASASATPSAAPSESAAPLPSEDPQETEKSSVPTPFLWSLVVAAGVLLLLTLPCLWRRTRRARRLSAAERGDARAAWREVQDTLIDHGERLAPSETVRQLAQRIDAEGLRTLAAAVENAAYREEGDERVTRGAKPQHRSLEDTLRRTLDDIEQRSSWLRRTFALLIPRSLFVRPPSARRRSGKGESPRAPDVG